MSLDTFFDTTNIQEKTKKCNKCKEFKTYPMFYKGSAGNGSYMAMCMPCHKKLAGDVNKLRKEYPPPTDPNYKCPCCKKISAETSRSGKWMLDHDHITGEFRAYLCHSCNLMIGNARDDPNILRQGAEYLEAWSNPDVKLAIKNGFVQLDDN